MAGELRITTQGDSLTLYVILRNRANDKVWSVTNTQFETWADGSVGAYDIALTSKGGDLYTGDFPTAIASGTNVDAIFYQQGGGAPAITDLKLKTERLTWNGVEASSGSSVTLASGGLTTLASVKRYLDIASSNTDYDTILTELINMVSDKIKTVTNRDFVATNYWQWYSGQLERQIVLRQRPIIYVNGVFTGSASALEVSYGGSGIQASVQVLTDRVRLRELSAAGTWTETDVEFGTYPTASTIATQITTVTNFTGTLKNDTYAYHLKPTSGVDLTTSAYTIEYADQHITAYEFDDETGILTLDGSGDVFENGFGGAVDRVSNVVAGNRNYLIDYRAGYAAVPDDVALVANRLIQMMWQAGKLNAAVDQESLGDYSYSNADRALAEAGVERMLANYMEVAVA